MQKCEQCELTSLHCRCTSTPRFKPEGMSRSVKSDGGSSKYYQLEVKVPNDKITKLSNNVSSVKLETGDIIRALVDNDFDLGNVIKACRRIHLAKQGKGKEGTSVEYDCKKIDYFIKEWYKAYCLEQV